MARLGLGLGLGLARLGMGLAGLELGLAGLDLVGLGLAGLGLERTPHIRWRRLPRRWRPPTTPLGAVLLRGRLYLSH